METQTTTRRFTLILDEEMFKVMEHLSYREKTSVSAWVRGAISLKLNSYKRAKVKAAKPVEKSIEKPVEEIVEGGPCQINEPQGLNLFR